MTVRRRRLALSIVSVLALAVACTGGDGDSPATAGGQELKIGLLTPQKGPNAAAGREAQHGAQLAVDVINGLNPSIPLPLAAKAGLPNLGGAKVTLVTADAAAKTDAQVTAGDAINKLVSTDGVNALIGAYDPQVTEYASQRSERYEIPFVNGDSPATFLTDAGRDWFFRIGPSWRTSGESFFSLLREMKAKTGKIAIYYADDKAGNDIVSTVKELAAEGGAGTVKGFPYAEAGTNIGDTVDKVKAFNPDALFLYVTPATVNATLTSFAVRQYKPPAAMGFSLGYLNAGDFARAAGAANGLLRAVSWSTETAERNKAGQAIAALYLRRFNSPMTEAAASSFTAVMTVAQAANNAGSVQNQRIRSALLSLDVPGEQTVMPWAGIQFDETHQNVLAQSLVEQYLNGAFRIVYPSDSTDANIRAEYPAP
ncbi:MAG TPA: ABC transporter substrate-binding protein [Mycobacteriales bacterium]